jgi:single-stranded-DNA-specific exonuclease
LKRLRSGRGNPGLVALLRVAGRFAAEANCFDLGFILGPRLNAAGRLADMSLGIECLLAEDEATAANRAQELDRLNRERRQIESGMLDGAVAALDALAEPPGTAIALFDAGWHQGVVGILAARVRERMHRPTICFARAANGELRGSGRSIPGLHLRDCLDLIAKREPGLLLRFGGHAQAAGLTIEEPQLERFAGIFERTVATLLPEEQRLRVVETDGALEPAYHSLEVAQMLESHIWGQGFPQPLFCDTFSLESQRVVGGKHLKLQLLKDGKRLEAMRFGALAPLPATVRAAYRIAVNEFDGLKSVQLVFEHVES